MIKSLGKRLKTLREEKDLTQGQLAKLVNLSQQTIGHYEVDRAKPDLETLQKLAEVFNCSIDYILGRTNIRRPQSQVTETPTDYELEKFLRESNVKFGDEPLDDEDKQDIINFLKILWNRKKDK